jgi:hypothetical protein
MSATVILVRYKHQRFFSIAREGSLGSLEGSANGGAYRCRSDGWFRIEQKEPVELQARFQSPSKGPPGPTVGSESGKTKWAIRSVMAAVGASRQMSQSWSGG